MKYYNFDHFLQQILLRAGVPFLIINISLILKLILQTVVRINLGAMEPTSLTAAAIATLVLTKAFEKTGEKLSEKAWELSDKLLGLIRQKKPKTATAIEKVAEKPELTTQQLLDSGEAELINSVEELTTIDPEIQATVELLAKEVAPQVPTTIENWKGINVKGGINTISNNTLNF